MIIVIQAKDAKVGEKIAFKMKSTGPSFVTNKELLDVSGVRLFLDDEWQVDLPNETLIVVERRF
jgi:hypothetical protein